MKFFILVVTVVGSLSVFSTTKASALNAPPSPCSVISPSLSSIPKVTGVTFLPDKKVVTFSNTSDGRVGDAEVIDLNTGKAITAFKNSASSTTKVLSSDGKLIAFSSMDSTGCKTDVYNTQTGDIVLTVPDGCSSAFTPSSERILVSSSNAIRILDISSGQEQFSYWLRGQHIQRAGFVGNGRDIFVDMNLLKNGVIDPTHEEIDVIDTATRQIKERIQENIRFMGEGNVFSSDGIFMGSQTDNVFSYRYQLINLQTGNRVISYNGPAEKGFSFSADGSRIALSTENGGLEIYRTSDGAKLRAF